ncbi:hypothetical protein BD626DRAFT_478153 [Schizophyllum amplum]|uniref:Uncharacterized protein n=1 Tax=Schizophyllum amplum TaxID=97359 RepID=A0A550D0T9_9AGAR|nr:hypothetical protein BD626DRAFT_478153 [Auriculariopsis ampla]
MKVSSVAAREGSRVRICWAFLVALLPSWSYCSYTVLILVPSHCQCPAVNPFDLLFLSTCYFSRPAIFLHLLFLSTCCSSRPAILSTCCSSRPAVQFDLLSLPTH